MLVCWFLPHDLVREVGNDTLRDGASLDSPSGGQADDWLYGSQADDLLYGNRCNDRIEDFNTASADFSSYGGGLLI